MSASSAARRSGRSRQPAPPPDPATWNEELWEALRARRTELARAQSVPPYVIFHDATLREMVARRPRTLDDLAMISGVGETKLRRYGEAFLEVVAARGNADGKEDGEAGSSDG